jgi:acylphosphatase
MAKRLLISGRVQGVGYRDAMHREALRLGALGWVRNLGDGRVEAVVDGTAKTIEALVNWAHHGPPAAAVREVRIEACAESCAAFLVKPNA